MDIKKEEEQPITEPGLSRKRASGARNSSDCGAKRSSMMDLGEKDVKVEMEDPDIRNIGSSFEPISYVPISPNVKRIPAQVTSSNLENVVKKEEPVSIFTDAPCRVFMLHSFQLAGPKNPTKDMIHEQITRTGAPPIPLEHLKTINGPPQSVGKVAPRVLAVKFEIVSDHWANKFHQYMESEPYKDQLRRYYLHDAPVITPATNKFTQAKNRMIMEVGRLIKVERIGEFVTQAMPRDGFEAVCHKYKELTKIIFLQMSCAHRGELIRAAGAFKVPFHF